jgi:hypothetical protein
MEAVDMADGLRNADLGMWIEEKETQRGAAEELS